MTDAQHAAVSAAPGMATPNGTVRDTGDDADTDDDADPGPQAVLFDMDGLLIDSEPLWFGVETDVMTRLGGTWTEADQQELLGSSLANAVRYFLERATAPADPAQIAEWMIGGIVARVRERGVTIMPGAAELVAEVEAAGLPYALVTSSQRGFVDAVLARTGLRFPVVVCANDVTYGKPDPESYLLAAKRLGAEPGRCLVLEDSITGVTAAEAAGCQVVAVPTLRPIEPRPGRRVVRTLRGIGLGWLRVAWAGRPELLHRPCGPVLLGRVAGKPYWTLPLDWALPLTVFATLGWPASASGSRSGKWHAARCPFAVNGRSGGSCSAHRS
jgi:HAD superfamily hydrolase (TIGR01509 family)